MKTHPALSTGYLRRSLRAIGFVSLIGGGLSLSHAETVKLSVSELNVIVSLPPFCSTETFIGYNSGPKKPSMSVGIRVDVRKPDQPPEASPYFLLLRFDISTLPKGAKISKAALCLTPYRKQQPPEGYQLWIEQISAANADWVQGKTTDNMKCDPTECYGSSVGYYRKLTSYTDAGHHSGENWVSGPGVFGREGDIDSVDGKHPLKAPWESDAPCRFDLKAATIQGWLSNPALAKAGLALHLEGPKPAKNFWVQFYSHCDPSPDFRPCIEVEYTK